MTQPTDPGNPLVPRTFTPESDLLGGRIILVTGAARGLGRGVAEACAAAGATVVLLDKDLQRLEAVYDAIEGAGHPQPVLHPLNLEGAGPAEYLELASALERDFGGLDGIVHNAAMLGELSPMDQYDPELWARTLHVNVNAPFLLNQATLALLRRSDRGRVLFVGDRVGREGTAFWGAYAVSKHAQEGMMTTLAAELGTTSSVRTMSIDPGVVATALRGQAYPGEDSAALAQPVDVAPRLLYPLGPAGDGLQGARLRLE